MDSDLEITLEANPTSVEAARFAALAAAGVNRLSLGIQALDDAALNSSAAAIAPTRRSPRSRWRAGISRASFDLIYARPGQTRGGLAAELERALASPASICRSIS